MPSVFFSYSHADADLRDQLEKQLSILKRQGVITTWHDRRIGAGEELHDAINAHVETDDIILLLVSADFLDSDYCYDREMTRALERHAAGDAIVIPVILRACDWQRSVLGNLNATPPDGKPITQWPDRDQALLEVAKAVRGAAERLTKPGARPAKPEPTPAPSSAPALALVDTTPPRSSNLRIAKEFTERDLDRFQHEAFEYIAKYFDSSLAELQDRNPEIEGTYRRIDANRFTAVVYRGGSAVARCTIFMGAAHLGGIAYVTGETSESNSFNEDLVVDSDDQMMFLRSMGMTTFGHNRQAKLTLEGAAEFYWGLFIKPLQERPSRLFRA